MTAIFNFEDPRIEITDHSGHKYRLFATEGDDAEFCLRISEGDINVIGTDLHKEFINTCIQKKLTLNCVLRLISTRLNMRMLIDIIQLLNNDENIINVLPYIDITGKTLKDIFRIPIRYICYIIKYVTKYDDIVRLYNTYHFSVEDFQCIKDSDFLPMIQSYDDFLYIKNLSYTNYGEYKDYLNMIENLTGYPRHPKDVKSYHNRAIVDYNKSKNKVSIEKQKKYTEMFLTDAMKLNFKNETYSIFACEDLNDLIIEGCVLHHCVASYVDSVANGREFILFLRKNNELDLPYFTVDVCGKQVRQIHGSCNCDPSGDVLDFINTWLEKFELDWNSNSRLCHV